MQTFVDCGPAGFSVPGQGGSAGSRVLGRAHDAGRYRLRMASGLRDVQAAQELRFMVFNLELNEGLEQSYHTLRDADAFDDVCDHLLVEEASSGEVVGTYRLQTGWQAAAGLGYYSAQEFDMGPLEPVRGQLVELGRACVHRDHRSLPVLSMLWRGFIAHARERGCRYLVGCSSLPTADEAAGAAAFRELSRRHLVEERFRTFPQPGWECRLEGLPEAPAKIPGLLRAYLSLGAKVAGPPALDRSFGTIDFLTIMDLNVLPSGARRLLG
ncbi:MAG: GNAT family N-acetyltransferase [Verrucomicrobiota bacterium]